MPIDWDQYGTGTLAPEHRRECFTGRDRVAIESLAAIYGQEVNDLLNALHSLAARLGIAAEVDPEGFAKGVQYHWSCVCEHLEKCSERATKP